MQFWVVDAKGSFLKGAKGADYMSRNLIRSCQTQLKLQPTQPCATFYHYHTPRLSHSALKCPKVLRKQQDNFIKIGTLPEVQMLNAAGTEGLAGTCIWFMRPPGRSAVRRHEGHVDGGGGRLTAQKRWLLSELHDGHGSLERAQLSPQVLSYVSPTCPSSQCMLSRFRLV